mmetsp:Transcript_23830/g.34827  ORF Transcript_23830/g.34827 Transcript_23830/m.34827 type:complete len:239 (+) Transcript_23830:76-792(+)
MVRRATLLPSMLALVIACSDISVGTSSNAIHDISVSYTRRAAAFAVPPILKSKAANDAKRSSSGCSCMRGINSNDCRRMSSSLTMIPSSQQSIDALLHNRLFFPSFLFNLPSIVTSYENEVDNAFQDEVTLSDLTSDPTLQAALIAAVIAVIALSAAKAFVTEMDGAVEKVALDFDRMMTLKYNKKWEKLMMVDDDGDGIIRNEGDRIQKVVEAMERLTQEEPEFMERVMRDIERMNN